MGTAARVDSYGRSAAPQRPASRHAAWRERLDCRFPAVDEVFDGCLDGALRVLDREADVAAYIDQARWLAGLGRGPEPVLAFLEAWPSVVEPLGAHAAEAALRSLAQAAAAFQKSPNGPALAPLLHSLPAVARRLRSADLLGQYLALTVELMQRSSVSIHGRQTTGPSPSLPTFLRQAPLLVAQVPLDGLRRWVQEGLRLHGAHPQRQIDFFALSTPDARALLARERHGTLLADAERRLALTLRGLWGQDLPLIPYPVLCTDGAGADTVRQPYVQDDGLRLPEVLDARAGVPALQLYRAMLAHMAGHRRWSTPLVADNLSPLQRLAVECVEDARIDALALRRFPGLRPALLALHPAPAENCCDPAGESCLRHRLACLSRALLDPSHGYRDPALREAEARFRAALACGESSTAAMRALAIAWSAATRRQSDQLARVHFEDTEVPWRDDNRHLWRYIEAGDEEDTAGDEKPRTAAPEAGGLPPRHYPEWDAATHSYRPDWTSVYDTLQPAGSAADIDALLARHAAEARQLQRLLDRLKPQDRTRLRQQEEGTELDLDVALRALSDWRAGAQPDSRIHMRTRTDGRDIALMLLMDLSQSVDDTVPGTGETVLGLSRAAVALLAGAVAALGDRLAIVGFHSNTRHEVRLLHIKGFGEAWDERPKARLAGVRAGWSTRMGAALRHAGHLLSGQTADKRLLLVLTDGRPADIDVPDPEHLSADAAQAVRELDRQGHYTHCISLDAAADDYVGRIFGPRWSVVDRVAQLPLRLPEIVLRLTR